MAVHRHTKEKHFKIKDLGAGGFTPPFPPASWCLILKGANILSIYYNPEIIYRLDDLPPQRLHDEVLSKNIIFDTDILKEAADKVSSDIDFVIYLCEKELKDFKADCSKANTDDEFIMQQQQALADDVEDKTFTHHEIMPEELDCGFESYKEAAIKKYYCNLPLSYKEEVIIKSFEDVAGGLEGSSAADIYPTALSLKKELDLDRTEIENSSSLQDTSLNHILDTIEDKLTKYSQLIDDFQIGYDKDLYDQQLDIINARMNRLESLEKELKKEYQRTVSNGERDRAITIKEHSKNIKKDISDLKSNLSFLATTTHAYLRKAQASDTYIEKMAYTLLASPMDKLDKTICCLLKLLLKQLDIDLSKQEIDDLFYGRLKVDKVINGIYSLQALLNVMFYQGKINLDGILNRVKNFLHSPIRQILSKVLNLVLEYKIKSIGNIEELFGAVLTSDYDNPDNLLDCIHFEAFADFIYEGMEDLDKELRDRIIDFYKFIYNTIDILGDDALEIEKREKIRQINRILSLLIDILEDIDGFAQKLLSKDINPQRALEELLENILIRYGYGTTYNSQTGNYERISLEGCLDQGRDTGGFNDYLSGSYDKMPSLNLDNNRQYKSFLENHKGFDFNCQN